MRLDTELQFLYASNIQYYVYDIWNSETVSPFLYVETLVLKFE